MFVRSLLFWCLVASGQWGLADPAAAQREPVDVSARWSERTAELGIAFRHRHFGSGEKYMPENMAPGVAVFDANGDGRLDLFFPQGAPLETNSATGPVPVSADSGLAITDHYYEQHENGSFVNKTGIAGLARSAYGMGAYTGDINGDGWLDLYVTRFGPNDLYVNRGDGTFEHQSGERSAANEAWSTGAGFFDPDADGDLDLLVVNYVDFAFDRHRFCGDARRQLRSYCHPDVYSGLADTFYLNDGRGHFTHSPGVGLASPSKEKGLGVIFSDFDGDGRPDAYIANDSTMNRLYVSRMAPDGSLRFEEGALLAGVAVNGSGKAEASMGLAAGDVDGDGHLDLFATHLDQETNTLYRNLGNGSWTDVTERSGLASPSLPWVGFGTVLFDQDNDGDLDLFVTNGHIIDNISELDDSRQHAQPTQLFDNQGNGKFHDISASLGLSRPLVGRGAVGADLDRDGDLDLVITQNDGPAIVLSNDLSGSSQSLEVRLIGRESNRFGLGARLELVGQDGKKQVRDLQSSSSYLSQGPPEVHFGLGSAGRIAQLTVEWPSGQIDRYQNLEAGYLYTLVEGETASGAAEASSPPAIERTAFNRR